MSIEKHALSKVSQASPHSVALVWFLVPNEKEKAWPDLDPAALSQYECKKTGLSASCSWALLPARLELPYVHRRCRPRRTRRTWTDEVADVTGGGGRVGGAVARRREDGGEELGGEAREH